MIVANVALNLKLLLFALTNLQITEISQDTVKLQKIHKQINGINSKEVFTKSTCLISVHKILYEIAHVKDLNIIYGFFTPRDNITHIIAQLVSMPENKEIYVMAYGITCPIIINSLLRFAQKKDNSLIMLIDRQYYNKVYLDEIKNIPNAQIYEEKLSGIAHNKVILIIREDGGKILMTGSFNFTNSAQKRNGENFIIVIEPENKFYQILFDDFIESFIKDTIGNLITLYKLNFIYRLNLSTTRQSIQEEIGH